MQILLIATGEEPKLQPLTTTMPSPMLPVANRPVLAVAVEMLARQGFKEMNVSLAEQGEQIEGYFVNGARWGVRLRYHLQQQGWGDAGAFRWANLPPDETTLIMPGDVIADVDAAAITQFHQVRGSLITVVLAPATATTPNPVWVQADGSLSREPLASEPLAYTGIYLVEPQVTAHIPTRQLYTFAADLMPLLLAQGLPVYGFKLTGYWNPLHTFADYQAAQIFYLDSAVQGNGNSHSHIPAGDGVTTLRYPTLDSHRMGPGVWVGKQAVIHPNALLRPPVLIGDNCRIGRDVELGPYAILGSGVVVDDEATVENSVVLERTYIGQLVKVTGRVVHKQTMIDPVSAESTTVTDQFLLGESSLETVGLDMRRVVDVAAALLLLVLFSPFLLVGMGVALLTRGRVFEKTAVVGGRAGQPFSFMKYGWAVRPGGWLTRLGWQRLPELFNLLRGEMSLVGIQPLSAIEAESLTETWQNQRYKQPVGLTGLWYTQATATPEELLMADTYYAATRTWRKDVHILWQTPGVWLRRVGKGNS